MKKTVFMFIFLFVSGCSVSPPEPPQSKGDWVELNTNISDIVRG